MGDLATKKRNPLIIECPPGERVIHMRREFDFPRELIWSVYTDGRQMKHWWGPSKYDTVVHAYDFRNGGKWRIDNVTRDGKEVHPFKGEFSGIKAPFEFTWTFGYADFPPGTETYKFVDLPNGRTRIECVSVFPDVGSRDAIAAGGMEEGARETYERLDDLLDRTSKTRPANPIVRFTRTVKAPAKLVYEVWTKPEHLAQWFSPDAYTVEGVESDPRPGGIFKLIMRPKAPGAGEGFWSVGKYLEAKPYTRLVTRVGGEGPDGALMFEVINTAIFEEKGDTTVIHASGEIIAIYDAEVGTMAMAGMEEGWKQTLDRFEAQLTKVARGQK